MSVTTKAIAEVLHLTPRAVLIRASAEGWAHQTQGKAKIFDLASLPAEIRGKFEAPASMPQEIVEPSAFAQAREKDRSLAMGRAALISAYKQSGLRVPDFLDAYHRGLIEGPWHSLGLKTISEKTFYAWLLKFKREGGSALVPKWSLRSEADGPGHSLPSEVKDFLKAKYLVQNKPSATSVYFDMVAVFGKICHPSTVVRYLSSLPTDGKSFHRDGPSAWRDRMVPIIDRPAEDYAPMEQVQSDHHHFDFFISYRGKLARPWVTVMVDFATGKCLSAIPSMGPNSGTIAMAYVGMGLEFGFPEELHTDNGKDYLSKALRGADLTSKEKEEEALNQLLAQGLYQICGTKLILATPYSGRSKGRTERMFASWAQYFARRWPTYCGSNSTTKPEDAALLHRSIKGLPQRKVDALDWDLYVAALAEFVQAWNSQWVGNVKGRKGMTADQAFASRPHRSHQVDPTMVETHMGAPCKRVVQGCYVTVDNLEFYSRELGGISGKKVAVKRLFHAPNEVAIFDEAGRLITRARAGIWTETEDLSEILERQGTDIKYLRQKARALKPDIAPVTPGWMPVAVGAEPKALPAETQKPASKTLKLISPLDAGFAKEM